VPLILLSGVLYLGPNRYPFLIGILFIPRLNVYAAGFLSGMIGSKGDLKQKKARIFLNNDFSLCRQLQLTHNLKVFFYLQKKTIFAQVKNMNLHKATYFHTHLSQKI
jgi:hypothetical protein